MLAAGSLCEPWPGLDITVTVSSVILHRPTVFSQPSAEVLLLTAVACKASIDNSGQAFVREITPRQVFGLRMMIIGVHSTQLALVGSSRTLLHFQLSGRRCCMRFLVALVLKEDLKRGITFRWFWPA